MKPITKWHNLQDYYVLLIVAGILALLGIGYKQNEFYAAAIVLIALAAIRRYWLHKRLS